MLNSTEILANVLGERLAEIYTRAFSSREPRYAELIGEAAKLVLERIGMSDALYHSAEQPRSSHWSGKISSEASEYGVACQRRIGCTSRWRRSRMTSGTFVAAAGMTARVRT